MNEQRAIFLSPQEAAVLQAALLHAEENHFPLVALPGMDDEDMDDVFKCVNAKVASLMKMLNPA